MLTADSTILRADSKHGMPPHHVSYPRFECSEVGCLEVLALPNAQCLHAYTSHTKGPERLPADVTMPCGDAASGAKQQARLGALREALDKARRAQKPLIISRLPVAPESASSQKSARTDCLYGDPSLLAALQPIVRPRAPALATVATQGMWALQGEHCEDGRVSREKRPRLNSHW